MPSPIARSSLAVLRDQARLRCGPCREGVRLALNQRVAPYWLHFVSDEAVVRWLGGGCLAANIYDRMVAWLQAPAAVCQRCACREIVGQAADGSWGHGPHLGELCGRRDELRRLTDERA